jgi:hypothetical protein
MAAMTLGLKLVLEGGNLKSPWVIDTTTEDGYVFVKLSLSCRSFASLCGADMSTRAPLKNNSFLERLAALRDSDIAKLLKTANEARGVKLSRKEFVDEIDKYIVVNVPGFQSSDGFIDGASIKLLVSSSSLASPSIEATPANFEFVRLGVRSCFDGPSPKRRRGERRSHGQFEGCPNVRWNEKTRGLLCSVQEQRWPLADEDGDGQKIRHSRKTGRAHHGGRALSTALL